MFENTTTWLPWTYICISVCKHRGHLVKKAKLKKARFTFPKTNNISPWTMDQCLLGPDSCSGDICVFLRVGYSLVSLDISDRTASNLNSVVVSSGHTIHKHCHQKASKIYQIHQYTSTGFAICHPETSQKKCWSSSISPFLARCFNIPLTPNSHKKANVTI